MLAAWSAGPVNLQAPAGSASAAPQPQLPFQLPFGVQIAVPGSGQLAVPTVGQFGFPQFGIGADGQVGRELVCFVSPVFFHAADTRQLRTTASGNFRLVQEEAKTRDPLICIIYSWKQSGTRSSNSLPFLFDNSQQSLLYVDNV